MSVSTHSVPHLARRTGAVAALALSMLGGGMAMAQAPAASAPAPAQTAAPAATQTAPAPAAATAQSKHSAPALTIRQIYDRMEAAGYRDLREIEWSHGHYEVKGLDAQGVRVKLDVDGSTGAVLRSRSKRH